MNSFSFFLPLLPLNRDSYLETYTIIAEDLAEEAEEKVVFGQKKMEKYLHLGIKFCIFVSLLREGILLTKLTNFYV